MDKFVDINQIGDIIEIFTVIIPTDLSPLVNVDLTLLSDVPSIIQKIFLV